MRLPNWILACWLVATVADATLVSLGPEYLTWRWATKWAIVGSLLVGWLTLPIPDVPLKTWLTAALALYLFGDLFLLRSDEMMGNGELSFKAGLGAFLVGHVCFIYAFRSTGQKTQGLLRRRPWLLGLLLGYAAAVSSVILPKLSPALLFPVVLYIVAISTLTAALVNRGGRVPWLSFQYGMLGAVFFMVSDTLLAYSLFVSRFAFDDVLVITTYAVAQFGLVSAAYSQVAPDLQQL